MTTEKITKREMFEAIKGLAESGALHMFDFNENISDEAVAEFCANEIDLLDKKTAKAKERAAAKRAEGDELTEQIYDVLSSDEFMTIPEIVKALDDEDVSAQKASYRLRTLVSENRAEKTEVSVPGTDGGKASKKVAYRKIVAED